MPKAKVHLLPGIAAPQARTPNKAVIDILKEALAEARKGDIQAVALTYITSNSTVVTDWTGGRAPANLLVAGVARLQHRVITAANNE